MLTGGLLSELQREFKNEKHSRDVSAMVICFHIRMQKTIHACNGPWGGGGGGGGQARVKNGIIG